MSTDNKSDGLQYLIKITKNKTTYLSLQLKIIIIKSICEKQALDHH